MSDIIVVDGDILIFDEVFTLNQIFPVEICLIKGSGEASIDNKKMCISGDEKKVSIEANYKSDLFPIPGNGTITISALAADQLVTFATATTPVIKVGSNFTALFTVNLPASNTQTGDDKAPSSVGKGRFINSQQFVMAD